MKLGERSRFAFKVAIINLLLSGIFFGAIAFFVFKLWYPYPYREIVGGTKLFLLAIAVNVICGPLLAAIVSNPQKSKSELTKDLSVIGLIQLTALSFGLYALFQARPVYLAFEVDRFRVVTYADIKKEDLNPDVVDLHRVPLTGVRLIGTRTPKDGEEMIESLDLSLKGFDPSSRPKWWVDYDAIKNDVIKKAFPISNLLGKYPDHERLIKESVEGLSKGSATILWLPVTSFRSMNWIVLIDGASAKPIGFLPLDGF